MNKLVIRRWLLEALLAIVVLAVPFFLVFMGTSMVPALVSFWATALILLRNARKQNPDVTLKTRYQVFEKFLYFQIINLSFALWLVFPMLTLVAIVTVIVLVIMLIKTRKEPNLKVVKWAKYTGFQVFNLVLLVILMGTTSEVSDEAIFFVMPMIMITFINGIQSAFFMKLEQAMVAGGKQLISWFIILAMIVTTAWSMFPR